MLYFFSVERPLRAWFPRPPAAHIDLDMGGSWPWQIKRLPADL